MTTLECERCGAEFDTDREGGHPGADTTRCPKCGKQHDVDGEGGNDENDKQRRPKADERRDPVVRIIIEVHPEACVEVATDERCG